MCVFFFWGGGGGGGEGGLGWVVVGLEVSSDEDYDRYLFEVCLKIFALEVISMHILQKADELISRKAQCTFAQNQKTNINEPTYEKHNQRCTGYTGSLVK